MSNTVQHIADVDTPKRVYKKITWRNIHGDDTDTKITFTIEIKGRTNIDLILKSSYALKNPENWEFYEIQG